MPFGPLTAAWRGLGLLGLLGMAGAGAWASMQAARFNQVHLLNALAQPVDVQLGDQALTLAPTSSEVVTVPTGTHGVTVRLDSGEVLEEGELEVPMLADAVAWNVAGASFLYLEHIAYVAEGTPPEDREPTIYCGERAVVVDDVDFPFREPKEEVSMSDSED